MKVSLLYVFHAYSCFFELTEGCHVEVSVTFCPPEGDDRKRKLPKLLDEFLEIGPPVKVYILPVAPKKA